MTLPADTYAWRPTRVQFMAKKNSLVATTLVQMRPATPTLAPSNTVLEQYSMLDTILPTNYAWQSFNFLTLDPLPSGGAVCLVLQHQVGCEVRHGPKHERISGTLEDHDNRRVVVVRQRQVPRLAALRQALSLERHAVAQQQLSDVRRSGDADHVDLAHAANVGGLPQPSGTAFRQMGIEVRSESDDGRRQRRRSRRLGRERRRCVQSGVRSSTASGKPAALN